MELVFETSDDLKQMTRVPVQKRSLLMLHKCEVLWRFESSGTLSRIQTDELLDPEYEGHMPLRKVGNGLPVARA